MPHKLLLADDSITIQRVIELTFADEDVQVFAVGDGKKAIESIQSDRPDIVLADVGMPERDGYEVAEFVKRNPQLANIPVLLLTGAFEPIDETRARAVGCDGVLVKPFEPQMVINRVKDLLAGRRAGGLWGAKPAAAPEPDPTPVENEPSSPPGAPAAGPATSASLEEYFDRLDAAFASVEAATEARTGASAIPPVSPTPPATSGSTGTPVSGLSTDDFPGWDPDLTGDPQRPAAAVTAPVQPPREPPPVQRPAPIPVSTAPPAPPPSAPEKITPAVASVEVHERPYPPAPSPVSPATAASTPRPVADAPTPAHTASAPAERPSPSVPASVMTASAPPAAPSPLAMSVPSLAEAFAVLLSAEQRRRVSPSTVGSSTISDETIDEIVAKVIARMTDTAVREAVLDVAERLVREEIDRIKAH
jgi:CheY-like chemotaxis protein